MYWNLYEFRVEKGMERNVWSEWRFDCINANYKSSMRLVFEMILQLSLTESFLSSLRTRGLEILQLKYIVNYQPRN